MKLELKAKHFEGTEFFCNKCAIGKAYKDLTGLESEVGICFLSDKNSRFYFNSYSWGEFDSDKLKAETHNWDDTVIRTIELIES